MIIVGISGTISFMDGKMVQHLQMDFFNYAGIQRAVKLYTTPKAVHLDDITVTTSLLEEGSAQVDFILTVSTNNGLLQVCSVACWKVGRGLHPTPSG